MSTVTAIFSARHDAERAIHSLGDNGFDQEQINLLTTGYESAWPVRGSHAGATVGAVAGLGAATLLPGVGPIVAIGMLASGLIGAGLGAAAGSAFGRHTHGIPNEDLYFYDEALRNGQAMILVDARDSVQETKARNLLERAGGRSVQSVRHEWWQNVRGGHRHEFNGHEPDYRAGFEAALHPATRGRDYDQVTEYVATCYGDTCRSNAFRAGYSRGQEYFRKRMAARETE